MSSKAACHETSTYLSVAASQRIGAVSRPVDSRARSVQPSSSVSVCSAKNSGVQRSFVNSQAVALAPCSQNSAAWGSAGLAHEQLTHWKPSGLFCLSRMRVPSSRMCASPSACATSLTDVQPPAACMNGWMRMSSSWAMARSFGCSATGPGRQGTCPGVVQGDARPARSCDSRPWRASRAHRFLEPTLSNPPTYAAPAPGQQPDPNRASQMFPVLSGADVERVRRFGEPHRGEDGSYLIRAGMKSRGLFLLTKGHVSVMQRDGLGRSVPYHEYDPGEFLAEAGTLFGGSALVDALCVGDVEGILVVPDQLRALIIAEADLGERIMRALILRRVSLIQAGASGATIIGSAGSASVLRLQKIL